MVDDLDQGATVRGDVGAGTDDHLDGCGGRGERDRVLQQFGEHQRHIVDDVGRDGDLCLGPQGDPLVSLDLAEPCPNDVDQGGRPGVHFGVANAGEQQQAVGVALEAYGDVVDAVHPLQDVGVGLLALHGVDQHELA